MKASQTYQVETSLMRIAVLFGIFGIALIGLVAVPDDDSAWWMEQFFISKGIAAAAFYAFYKLDSRWSKTDRWLKAYNESCDKALETPNPLYIGKDEDQ